MANDWLRADMVSQIYGPDILSNVRWTSAYRRVERTSLGRPS